MDVLDKPAGKDTPTGTVSGSGEKSQQGTRLQSHGDFYMRPKYNHKRDVHHNPIQGNGNSMQLHGRGGSGRIMSRGMPSNGANGSHDPQVRPIPMRKAICPCPMPLG